MITEPLLKLLPLAVNVNDVPPAVADDGEMDVSEGTGLVATLIVNVCDVLEPPPGVGVNTVTSAVPADVILAAGIVAVNCVAFTKVVVNAVPFQLIVEPFIKLLPLAVNVNDEPPALAEAGAIELNVGAGLSAE